MSEVKPIALLTADWHFMHNTWRHRPEINGDAYVSLNQVVSLAIRLGIPIIAAGDILDTSRPTSSLITELHDLLGGYAGKGFYVNGNHDKVKPSWLGALYRKSHYDTRQSSGWMDLTELPLCARPGWPNEWRPFVPHAYTGIRFIDTDKDTTYQWTEESPALFPATTDQWCAYGIDYVETAEKLQEKLDELKPYIRKDTKNLLVLHQGVEGLMPKMSVELFNGMVTDEIDIVLCGHTHISEVLTITTENGKNIPLISPGSLHVCSIDENPRKKVYVLAADGAIWSTPLATRRVISVNFSGSTEAEIRSIAVKVVATLKKKRKKTVPLEQYLLDKIDVPLLRVVYDTSTTPKVKAIFETALRDAEVTAHLFYTNRTEKVASELETVVQDGINATFVNSGFDYAKAAFRQLEKDKKVRRIVESILENNPSQESYETLKKEFTG